MTLLRLPIASHTDPIAMGSLPHTANVGPYKTPNEQR